MYQITIHTTHKVKNMAIQKRKFVNWRLKREHRNAIAKAPETMGGKKNPHRISRQKFFDMVLEKALTERGLLHGGQN